MLRINRLMGGIAAAVLALPLSACGQASSLYDSVKATVLPYVAAAQRLSGPVLDSESVVVMKLGLGIPNCRRHVASIAIRDGDGYHVVAHARSIRGVGARHVGLMATRLEPGKYFVVHGRCKTGRRVFDVGRPLGKFTVWPQKLRTSYATFEIDDGEVVNVGFLRFSRRPQGGRAKIKLQSIPGADLEFLAENRPRLRKRMTLRQMRLTGPDGRVFASRPAKPRKLPVKRRKKPKKKPRQRRAVAIPVKPPVSRPRRPAAPKPVQPRPAKPEPVTPQPAAVKPPVDARPKPPPPPRPPPARRPAPNPPAAKPPVEAPNPALSDSSITPKQREAACEALRRLKREGKVRQVPVTCLRLKLPRPGLPPAAGPDK